MGLYLYLSLLMVVSKTYYTRFISFSFYPGVIAQKQLQEKRLLQLPQPSNSSFCFIKEKFKLHKTA